MACGAWVFCVTNTPLRGRDSIKPSSINCAYAAVTVLRLKPKTLANSREDGNKAPTGNRPSKIAWTTDKRRRCCKGKAGFSGKAKRLSHWASLVRCRVLMVLWSICRARPLGPRWVQYRSSSLFTSANATAGLAETPDLALPHWPQKLYCLMLIFPIGAALVPRTHYRSHPGCIQRRMEPPRR